MHHAPEIEKIITRIKSWVNYLGLSKNKLADRADLAESTLRSFHRSNWNPTLHTLQKLESALPKGSPPSSKNHKRKIISTRESQLNY